MKLLAGYLPFDDRNLMVLYRGMLCIQHITSSSSKTLASADC